MSKNALNLRLAFVSVLLSCSLLSGGAAFGSSEGVREAYERYQKSYSDFKTAVDKNLDAETLRDLAERYKADLDNYKKLAGGKDGETPARADERISGEGRAMEGAAGMPADAGPASAVSKAGSEGAAGAQRTTVTAFEKAIMDFHSGDGSKLDAAIKVFENTLKNSRNAAEIERAKYELANAYMAKGELSKAGPLLKELSGAKGTVAEYSKKSLETLAYMKDRKALSDRARADRDAAIAKKAAYEAISWRNPIAKIPAKISEVFAAVKYRRTMSVLGQQAEDGDAGFFGTAKSFLTSLYKKKTKIDPADKAENELINDSRAWKQRQRIAALVSKSGGVYKICNVRWGFTGTDSGDEDAIKPKWRTVTIDTNAVREAYFVIKPFAPEWIAGHSFFMFDLDPAHPVVTEFGESSTSFIMSMEARQKEGQSYSFTGSFGVVYLLLSKEDYVQICAVNKSRLVPYRLALTDEQKKALFECALEEALKARGMERYELFENNCTNILFEMLNTVLPKDRQFREWILKKILYNKTLAIPKLAPKFLKRHGLIAETLPTIHPDPKNAADDYGKRLAGAELAAARERYAAVAARAEAVKKSVVAGTDAGRLDKAAVSAALYDSEAGMMTALEIPPAAPDTDAPGAFSIDERQFAAKMAAIKTKEELRSYVSSLFDAYKAGLSKRAAYSPDISKYLGDSLNELEARVK